MILLVRYLVTFSTPKCRALWALCYKPSIMGLEEMLGPTQHNHGLVAFVAAYVVGLAKQHKWASNPAVTCTTAEERTKAALSTLHSTGPTVWVCHSSYIMVGALVRNWKFYIEGYGPVCVQLHALTKKLRKKSEMPFKEKILHCLVKYIFTKESTSW